jgi:hypothetical protein
MLCYLHFRGRIGFVAQDIFIWWEGPEMALLRVKVNDP